MYRDSIEFTWSSGLVLAFTYTVDGEGDITLTPEPGMPEGDTYVWATKTWERVGD